MKWRFENLKGTSSPAYDHYLEALNTGTNEPVLVCKYCKTTTYAHPGRNCQGTTTSLGRHTRACTVKKELDSAKAKKKPMDKYVKNKPDITVVRQQVLKFFISGNIPFKQADNPEFQKLLGCIFPNTIASRKIIRTDLANEAKAAKLDLKVVLGKLDSKISLALDCWTSRTGFAFLGISPSPRDVKN
jgi:hypothetical protein